MAQLPPVFFGFASAGGALALIAAITPAAKSRTIFLAIATSFETPHVSIAALVCNGG